jgi:hypothetical protein
VQLAEDQRASTAAEVDEASVLVNFALVVGLLRRGTSMHFAREGYR